MDSQLSPIPAQRSPHCTTPEDVTALPCSLVLPPLTVQEGLESPGASQWQQAIDDEITF
jgi:hypothetical protein